MDLLINRIITYIIKLDEIFTREINDERTNKQQKKRNNNYETRKTLQTNYGVNAHTRLGRG